MAVCAECRSTLTAHTYPIAGGGHQDVTVCSCRTRRVWRYADGTVTTGEEIHSWVEQPGRPAGD